MLLHPADEPNLPANVKWFLPRTSLSVHDAGCSPSDITIGAATESSLQNATYESPCDHHVIRASGTRSKDRARTFVLADVDDTSKGGSADPSDWMTYYHAFRNKGGGWSLQYWVFYAYNTGRKVLGIEFGFHGGDWEMFQVDLDRADSPMTVAMTGHTSVETNAWPNVEIVDGHPQVYTEKGGHEMHLHAVASPPYIVHATWPHSMVFFPPDQHRTPAPAGALVDLGTKLHPSMQFLSYSGLWGSLGTLSSGYWGPAFNETGIGADGFLTAWCFNIADPAIAEGARRECYADDTT